jgi:hypothetical protein
MTSGFGNLHDAVGPAVAHRQRSTRLRVSVTRCAAAVAIVCLLSGPAAASSDAVLDWNAVAVTVTTSQGPFAQARFLAITQLAVFEAVNAIKGDYEPYLGTVRARAGASAEAAAATAAHRVLTQYLSAVPGVTATLDAALASSLGAIPDGRAKSDGIATGEAAAAALIKKRENDGSAPPAFSMPASSDPGVWQLTPSCPAAGGVFLQWGNVKTFGIPGVSRYLLDPPPALTSRKYTNDYLEVKTVGGLNSTERPQELADVARFFAASSPGFVVNAVARQVSVAQGRSLSHNARALALLNMSLSDSLVASFANKYHYNFWRPETAIRAGDTDGNLKTVPDPGFAPLIATPCFPSYPSNHASGTYGGLEVLTRIYGAGPHSITLSNIGLSLQYTRLAQIGDDVDDARVYGGIHFRFDQEAGARLGSAIGGYVYRHNLRRDHSRGHDHEDDCENDRDNGR